MEKPIKLNDILRFDDLSKVKIRFNDVIGDYDNPIQAYNQMDKMELLKAHYWNSKKKAYKEGQITVGLIRIVNGGDKWLLFHIGKITKDLNKLDAIGYEFEDIQEYYKYIGRLVIKFRNLDRQLIRNADTVLDECEVSQILPDTYNNDNFPGYDKVNLSWQELKSVIGKSNWVTALENQKGIYLITDKENGKHYVGSASGEQMLLGRWKQYVETGHGGNKELKSLTFEHIINNFNFSILEIYKSTTDDAIIRDRESWWKNVLQSRKFGYNEN